MIPLSNNKLMYYEVNKKKLNILKEKMIENIYDKNLSVVGDHSKNENYNRIV